MVSGVRRPDHVFYGLGPNSLQSDESRYGEDLVDGHVTLGVPMGRFLRLDGGLGLKSVSIYHGHYDSDPSVEVAAAAHTFALPYGFGRGYTEEYNQLRLSLDSRLHAPGGSGARVELEGEQGSDVKFTPRVRGGFLEVRPRRPVSSTTWETTGASSSSSGRRSLRTRSGARPSPSPGKLVAPSAGTA